MTGGGKWDVEVDASPTERRTVSDNDQRALGVSFSAFHVDCDNELLCRLGIEPASSLSVPTFNKFN